MRCPVPNLKTLLTAIVDGSASKQQQADIVHHSRIIIEAYLTHHRAAVAQLCLSHGLTITDLAYDCIGEAFGRDANVGFFQLKNFVAALRTPLAEAPDQEVFLAFKGFLTSVANAQLARLYALADAAQSRIYRNIKEATKHGRACFTITHDHRGYVLTPQSSPLLDHLAPYPYDELERHSLHAARSHNDVPALLDILSSILNSQNQYRRSLPMVDVVRLFKSVYTSEEPDEAEPTLPSDGSLTEEEIERLCRQVGHAIYQRIVLTYVVHEKLDRRHAEGMARAVYDYLVDLCCSHDRSTSLYHHVSAHLQITTEEYESNLRPKAEYMLKMAKEELAARLMKEL